ncbi:4983_t:CDS:2 [Gigaspora margarita]|uniref:4983_t:CDS:1 n=1 Tax=Gigaspora margarita TaxID=4874 RepID=A0ABN7UN65_GIGMA|nr:4983_t:CDS:2 [Gigaspora margarita]
MNHADFKEKKPIVQAQQTRYQITTRALKTQFNLSNDRKSTRAPNKLQTKKRSKNFRKIQPNQFILQDDKTLATWSQLKLIKGATRKGRKPIDLRGLAIPNLQRLIADRRIKNRVITKEIDSEPILGHIIKKNSNLVLIEHWKELDHLISSQSKLEKCRKCLLSTDPTKDSCTLKISKGKIVGILPKAALELASKMTKIKTNLW